MPAPKRFEPTDLNKWFALKITSLREAKGWSRQDLADAVRLSYSRIAQYERAEGVPPEDITKILDEVLESGGILTEAWPYLEHGSPDTKWAHKLTEAESKATKIRYYIHSVPGLLQTREYATVMLRSGIPFYGGDLDQKVDFRMERQAVLDAPNPPWIWTVLDESALYRTFGHADIMRDQLVHLLDLMRRPHVNVQIIPHDDGTLITGMGTTSIFELRDGRTVVYREEPEAAFVTDVDRVAPFVRLYDHLQAEALSPTRSREFIRRVVEEKYP
ncbi:Scr1 family TA system antitoxin-like transcriptional regulator [Streptomyces gamaensis]|uniref:Scr1 family TA system antitoxin-like transcriptional regulator n=1 Tax=Streptomyces gamaensis TaxID=1763542 RepID=A0ABW0Z444_9ACTN